jgi:diadenosine tetraphosphate (Ap4A) HIT family hydrolase
MNFSLHPDLVRDCIKISETPLCEVLLRNDARFPWLILVPRVAGASEWFDLSAEQQKQLHDEVMLISVQLKKNLNADKMNIAALGNITPQLHVHIIARFKGDAAWPNPVWGQGRAVGYSTDALEKMRKMMNITNL